MTILPEQDLEEGWDDDEVVSEDDEDDWNQRDKLDCADVIFSASAEVEMGVDLAGEQPQEKMPEKDVGVVVIEIGMPWLRQGYQTRYFQRGSEEKRESKFFEMKLSKTKKKIRSPT
jgi:hypothetical protein